MNIEIEEEGQISKVRLEGANEAIANSLRRAILTKVPTLSIQHMDITENGSALFDEMLAHRLGQVPFKVPANVSEEDSVHVAIQKSGPGKVKASDIKTDNEEAEPVNPEAIVATLKEDQEIEAEGEAELGKGKEHAKHQGATIGYEKVGEGEFLFRIESSSGYTNEELFQRAFEVLESDLEEFKQEVEDF